MTTSDKNFAHTVAPVVTARNIGARLPREEDRKLLTGRGEYLADVRLPGQVHAAFVRSSLAHARITGIDITEATALPGVLAVWTGADAAAHCEGLVGELSVAGCVPTTMPLLAQEYVRFVGEAIAVVVAEDRYIAEDACDLIAVDYDELPPVLDPRPALEGGPVANEGLPDNVALKGGAVYGDADKAFENAHKVVSATYHTGRLAALPMETRGCAATYDWTTQELRLWTSTQVPHYVKYCLTAYLGFPENHCEVITPDTGGGFGQKAHLFSEEMLIPLLAREVDRPVVWVEDRRENLMTATHAHEQFVDIAYAGDENGRLTAVRIRATGDGGAYHQPPWSMAVEPWCTAMVTPSGAYDIPVADLTYEAAATNKCPIGAYRGVGYMAGTLARECLMDEAARAYELSPFDIRRRNVVREFPWVNAQGITYDEGSWLRTIDELERMVDYEAFRRRQADLREQGRYIGLGLSVFVESSGESTAMSLAHGMGDIYHDTATVRMEPNGTVTVSTGLTTQGQGHRTTMAQVAADVLGIPVRDITVRSGDSTSYAWGSGTVGSRSAVVAGGAVLRAADAIRSKLVSVAAEMLKADAADIELADGKAAVKGEPDSAVNIADVAASIYFDQSVWPDGFDPTLEVTLAYDPARPVFSNGGHAVIVELDPETGFARVEKVFSVEDCGTMINPEIVEGQLRGGVVQGIGAALLERLVYDSAGQLTTTTLLDYHVPTLDVAPPFEIHHLETPSAHTPAGIKGMGESGLIAAPAAVLNAVNDALSCFGTSLYALPATPEQVLGAMSPSGSVG
ncbi:xanthine dehydrogenase family protein molybdopterin-binding subunit [Streptomyces graminofaciens]|uniref:xanthine dehydrogenase family protein molybdopterin-binding subunit n=1 Tax=Streptomyces graminofaciens TaxID=68212 RepID=UPI0025741D8D|nr:xanthine dehydrogenase family protein molybdopterin-binding subunit [Streptomyces graminofaciens]